MLKIEISETDMQHLHYERFHQLHPRVMLKIEVIYLNGLGLKLPHLFYDITCNASAGYGNGRIETESIFTEKTLKPGFVQLFIVHLEAVHSYHEAQDEIPTEI
jgi:hypothetical protein